MRIVLAATAGLLLAAPAFAQESDTLKEVTTKGISLDAGGFQLDVHYTPDGKFTAMDGQITGTWRIDGDSLCTATDATPEECVPYPKGKKSGDSFDVTSSMGTAKVTIK